MAGRSSLPPDYFQAMFAGDPDPWKFETSSYEAAKYDATIAALGDRFYERGFEVGCANGVLTKRLAQRCRGLLAVDVSEVAMSQALARNAAHPHVAFALMTFPKQVPDEGFDLIVLSEVVYYWSDEDIARAGMWIARHLRSGGDILLVHWIGKTDYPQTGDGAVTLLRQHLPGLVTVNAHRETKYRLDLWRRV